MGRDRLLPLCIVGMSGMVVLACIAASVALEIHERSTPPYVVGIAGTAIGVLHTVVVLMISRRVPPPTTLESRPGERPR